MSLLCYEYDVRLYVINDGNAAGRIKSNTGDDPCTSGINLVDFRPVTLDSTMLNVQQASISTLVSLSTFASGQHC